MSGRTAKRARRAAKPAAPPTYEQVGTLEGFPLKLLAQATAELHGAMARYQDAEAALQQAQQRLAGAQRVLDAATGAQASTWRLICEEHELAIETTRVNYAEDTPVEGFPAGAILRPPPAPGTADGVKDRTAGKPETLTIP